MRSVLTINSPFSPGFTSRPSRSTTLASTSTDGLPTEPGFSSSSCGGSSVNVAPPPSLIPETVLDPHVREETCKVPQHFRGMGLSPRVDQAPRAEIIVLYIDLSSFLSVEQSIQWGMGMYTSVPFSDSITFNKSGRLNLSRRVPLPPVNKQGSQKKKVAV